MSELVIIAALVLALALTLWLCYFLLKNREHNPIAILAGKDGLRGDFLALRGWTNTLKSLNEKVDVALFGDSLTCYGPFSDEIKKVKLCNLGYPGDDLLSMPLRVQQLSLVKPDMVFVMAGINSIGRVGLKTFRKQYEQLIGLIRKEVPESKVYVISMLPVLVGGGCPRT